MGRYGDAFLLGLSAASAAAVVAAVVALLKFVRRVDRERVELLSRVEHRQNHLLQWVRAVAHKLGVPFPLFDNEDEGEDENRWDKGI